MHRMLEPFGIEGKKMLFGYAFECRFLVGGFSIAVATDGFVKYIPFQGNNIVSAKVRSGPVLPPGDMERLRKAIDKAIPEIDGFEGRLSEPFMTNGGSIFHFAYREAERDWKTENAMIHDPDTECGERGFFEETDREEIERQNRLLNLFDEISEILSGSGIVLKQTLLDMECRKIERLVLETESYGKRRKQTFSVSDGNARLSTSGLEEDGRTAEEKKALKNGAMERIFAKTENLLLNREEAIDGNEDGGRWILTISYADGSDEEFSGPADGKDEGLLLLTSDLRRLSGFGKKMIGFSG